MGKEAHKLDGNSANIAEQKLDLLKRELPEAFTEGKIDFDRLKAALGEQVELGERYGLTWKGKSNVFRTIQEPTTKTLKPDRANSVNFDDSQNIFIEGDNLEALKILQKAYYGKIKMIYIDPPYNTGNDFVYNDKFSQTRASYDQESGLRDEAGNITATSALQRNSRDSGHFHSNWLNMMYPRLYLARTLLRDDGVIFVSIDDNEVHNLRLIMNEIFGEENFIGSIIWKRRQNVDSRAKNGLSVDHEYIICYSRTPETSITGSEKDLAKYSNPNNDPRGPWMSADMTGLATKDQRPNLHYDLTNPSTGIVYKCPPTGWRYERKRMNAFIESGEIIFPSKPDGRPRRKKYLQDLESEHTGFSTVMNTVFNTQGTRELRELFDGKEYFDFPKPVALLKALIKQGTQSDNNDIVLDFFSGSGTTAHAVSELNREDKGNRKWIMVQLNEKTEVGSEARIDGLSTIADLARKRIHRAAEQGDNALDSKFKTFTVAQTNFKIWDSSIKNPNQLEQQMRAMFDPVRQDASEEDLLIELLLKYGLQPTVNVKKISLKNGTYWSVDNQKLMICLAKPVKESVVSSIIATRPEKLILLDRSLDNDQIKTNVMLQLEKAQIEFIAI